MPFAPGGANDLIARILSVPLGQALGQTVVIENRGGANGNIGIAAAARAEPDGYTLLLSSNVFDVNPSLSKSASYDPIKDFAPISDLVGAPNVIAARPDTGLKTFADLVGRARAHPDELNFATPGAGSISHLGAELLKIRANINMVHVPYTGAGPALQAVLGGTVQLIGVHRLHRGAATQVGRVDRAGTDRQRAMGRPARRSDAGRSRRREFRFGDAAVAIRARWDAGRQCSIGWQSAVVDILKRPEVRAQLAKVNFRVMGEGPKAQQDRLAKDVATWKEVITKSGIKVD